MEFSLYFCVIFTLHAVADSAPRIFNITSDICGNPAVAPRIHSLAASASKAVPGQKIVGGEEAVPHSWPWQVVLLYEYSGLGFRFYCGGSLIDHQWVLTAGHCCRPFEGKLNQIRVQMGVHDRKDKFPVHELEGMFIHPYFQNNNETVTNDFCLLKTKENIEFSNTISPVCLPTSIAEVSIKSECYTSGWGSVNPNVSNPVTSHVLKQTNVLVIDHDVCQERYNSNGLMITNKAICATLPGTGPCFGDSGGPLVCRKGQKWELAGVTSFGAECGDYIHPSGYGRVGSALFWISSITSLN